MYFVSKVLHLRNKSASALGQLNKDTTLHIKNLFVLKLKNFNLRIYKNLCTLRIYLATVFQLFIMTIPSHIVF